MTPTLSTPVLLAVAAASVAALLILIMRLKLHAFLALVLVSAVTALVTGVTLDKLLPTLLGGFGSTLASVALLVGLGAMIGKLLEVSGGAQSLADTLVRRFGPERAPYALGLASLLFGFPIFFDAGLMVMLPIIFSVARRLGGSVVLYALPSAGAFAVMHAFLPPHPGPVAAADVLGAPIGLLTVIALVLAWPTWYLGAYLYGIWAGRRFVLPVPDMLGVAAPVDAAASHAVPRFTTVLSVLLLPLVLIFLETGLGTLVTAGTIQPDSPGVQVLRLLGKTPIALLVTVLYAMGVLRQGRSGKTLEHLCNEALGPVCAVILVTGAGGMFGGVLRASGIGQALADSVAALGLPVILAAFLIATALRVAQGSATVALTTTAALIAPMLTAHPELSPADLCFIVIAIACGSTVLSHVNDSGFWLVGRFLGMDEKTTLKTWTVLETLIGLTGFAFAVAGMALVRLF